MKNRKLLLIVSLVLAMTMSLGGTLAYLQDSDSDVNTMTLGSVKIEQHEYQRVGEDGAYETYDFQKDGNTVKGYKLEAFEQNKPLVPVIYNPGTSTAEGYGYDDTRVYMDQVKSYGNMQVFETPNAVDKFVTVENTGVSPAYVRTFVAFENGTGNKGLIGFSHRSNTAEEVAEGKTAPWIRNPLGQMVINGNTYNVYEFVYRGASDVNRHENGILPGGDTTYPNLCQVYIKSEATNEDLEALDGNKNGKLDILVLSQAVQADGFADATTALNAGFGEATAANVKGWFEGDDFEDSNLPVVSKPENNAGLEDALDANEKHIVIELTGDMEVDVTSWQTLAFGGENTETISIYGNGHTLMFNLKDGDWSHVSTNNEAKLILNDVNIKSGGYNSGHWKRNLIHFGCEVEMNNVTTECGIGFEKNAVVNDSVIKGIDGNYSMWIWANGQSVVIDGCTIGNPNGRAIKIADEDAENGRVALTVKDTTFASNEKAAILVSSTSGADITASMINISKVEADTTNAVWVDKDWTAHADAVTVNGCTKIVEP